jgi:hypothetical protein
MLVLKLTSDGDLDCSRHTVVLIDGVDRVSQQVLTTLKTFLGEWEFDLDAGVPWFQRIVGIKGVNLNDVQNVLTAAILAVPDVTAVTSFVVDFNRDLRQAHITAKIKTTFGATQVEGLFP